MIEKFEKKVNDIKKRLNPKIVAVIFFMLFSAIFIFSMEMANNFKREKQKAQNGYNKAMFQAVGYIKNLEVELAKLQIINTQKLTITTLASIWRQSNLAKENFESIPVNQNSLSNAAKFLSQLSDYSYTLMKQSVSDKKITDKEYEDIKTMYSKCKELSDVMSKIYDDLNNGRIKWDKLEKEGNEKLPTVEVETAISNLNGISKTFQEYEGLIYDGAFSNHIFTMTPKFLKDNEVSMEDAKKYIENIFGNENIEYINYKGESEGKVSLYNFDLKLNKSDMIRNISITKKDCKLYLMLADRKVNEEKITMEEAKKIGKEFLEKLEIYDIKDTYYLKTENMAIINYAACQDNVLLYPDLIKVKIALDTGEVCSVEAQGYIFNHTTRENITPEISIEEARNTLNKNVKIISEDVAIIPTDSMDEILTYEFKGKVDDREYLIYINAKTKQEERVLIIMDTPGGTLTM